MRRSSPSTKSRVTGGRWYRGVAVFLIFNSAPVEHGTQENPKLKYKGGRKRKINKELFKKHLILGEKNDVRFIQVSVTLDFKSNLALSNISHFYVKLASWENSFFFPSGLIILQWIPTSRMYHFGMNLLLLV